jgi:Cdc6-like AAA superfamily ATPase
MIVKHLNNIHNINSYCSIIESKNGTSIHLMKNDNNYTSINLNSTEDRDSILSTIWDNLSKGVILLDLDDDKDYNFILKELVIKYKNNIYNINKYYSIVDSTTDDNCLLLIKGGSEYDVLNFESKKMKELIIFAIWNEIIIGTTFLDIDFILKSIDDYKL